MKIDEKNAIVMMDKIEFEMLFTLLEIKIHQGKEDPYFYERRLLLKGIKAGLDKVYWNGWGLGYKTSTR